MRYLFLYCDHRSVLFTLKCTRNRLEAGLRRTRWESLSDPPNPLKGQKGRIAWSGEEGKGGPMTFLHSCLIKNKFDKFISVIIIFDIA